MCGLFGAFGTHPRDSLKTVMREAGKRGPNAWGVASLSQTGEITATTCMGKLTEAVQTIPAHQWQEWGAARALIGQSRLSTSGSYRDPRNNPPFIRAGLAIAHNGNVYNEQALTEQHGLVRQTGCDSEVILLLIEQATGRLLDRVCWALSLLDARSPLAFLALDATHLVAVRSGQPLYLGEGALCSRPFSPSCTLLPDRLAQSWASIDGTPDERRAL